MRASSVLFQFRRRYSLISSTVDTFASENVSACCQISTDTKPGVSWEFSSYGALLKKLEIVLDDNGSADEALEAFNNFRKLHGFPNHHLVNKMILSLSNSFDRQWLRQAYELMIVILNEKPGIIYHNSLTRLALALARAQMPVAASTVLRAILEKKFKPPSVDSWNIFFSHLVKTRAGSYLAAEILIKICETKPIKPSAIMFNLVLNSCLRFGSLLKAQQIIESMPHAGVVADANSIVIIARIYERIGQRDDLKKLQGNIDAASSSVLLIRHYKQFYDSLLSLHFKFNDLDAAADLVLNLYRQTKSPQPGGLQKQCMFRIGSSNMKTGSKILLDPCELQKDVVMDTEIKSEFVLFMDGKLIPSYKVFAKLMNGYVKERNAKKLSNLLIKIQNETDSKEATLCSDVIDACIHCGWLETAHDIIDDLESSAIAVGAKTYESLLRAYRKENMYNEAKSLLKQMKQAGHVVDLSDEKTAASIENSCLVSLLEREIKEEGTAASSMLYELNNSIRFFCKAKMMDDALRTFKRMQEKNIEPTVITFSYLVNGYSSLKMHRQITILWGEIRQRLEGGVLTADRDLLDCLLCAFLRGGYFERAMDIVNYTLKHNMFTDKHKYKREFLKLHKDLYRKLQASDAKTEAQSKRLEHVRAFRRWAEIHQKRR